MVNASPGTGNRNSAVAECAEPMAEEVEWQPPALSPMLWSVDVEPELSMLFLHEFGGAKDVLAESLASQGRPQLTGHMPAALAELADSAWQRVLHHIGSPWRWRERNLALEALAEACGAQLKQAMMVLPGQHAEAVRTLYQGSTPAWVTAALRRPFARVLSARCCRVESSNSSAVAATALWTASNQSRSSDERLIAGLRESPFTARCRVCLRALSFGMDILPMLAELGPAVSISVYIEAELADGSKTSWTSAATMLNRDSFRAVWCGPGSCFVLDQLPCAVVGMQCVVFCENSVERIKVATSDFFQAGQRDPFEQRRRRILVRATDAADSMDVNDAVEAGRGGLRRVVSNSPVEAEPAQPVTEDEWYPGKYLKLGAAKLAKSIQETHEELKMFIDDLDDANPSPATSAATAAAAAGAPEASELSLHVSHRSSALGTECATAALELDFQSCMLAAGNALRAEDRASASKALNDAELLKAEIDHSGQSDCLTQGKSTATTDAHLYMTILVCVVSWYAQRAFQHGEGWDLGSSDDESDSASNPVPAAVDEDGGLGRVGSVASSGTLDEWEDIVDESDSLPAAAAMVSATMAAKVAGSAAIQSKSIERRSKRTPNSSSSALHGRREGHRWPLALICPWRYQHLFADIADGVGVLASSKLDWLYQAGALLHTFPAGRMPPTYLRALQGLLVGAAHAEDMGVETDSEITSGAVYRLAEHALLRSIVDYGISYPAHLLDDGSLQTALEILHSVGKSGGVLEDRMKVQLDTAASGLCQPLLQRTRNLHHFSSGEAKIDFVGDPAEVESIVESCAEVCTAMIEFSNVYAPVFASASSLSAEAATEAIARPVYTELCTSIRHLLQNLQPICHEMVLSKLLVHVVMVNETLSVVTPNLDLLDIKLEFSNIAQSCIESVSLNLTTWTGRAIEVDDWQPIDAAMGARHSSSAQDIIEACSRSVETLQIVLFDTGFAQMLAARIGNAVESYVFTVLSIFRNEIELLRPSLGSIRDGSAVVPWTSIAVRLNNLWQATTTFSDLGDKLIKLHQILSRHGVLAWEKCIDRIGSRTGWVHLVENFNVESDSDMIEGEQAAAAQSPSLGVDEDELLADELDHTVLRLNQAYIGAFDDACRLISAELLRTETARAILSSIPEDVARTSFTEPWTDLVSWLSIELAVAAKLFYEAGMARFVRGLVIELEACVLGILLGDDYSDMIVDVDENISEESYNTLVENADGISDAILDFVQSLQTAGRSQLVKQKTLDNRFGDKSQIAQLLVLHRLDSSVLSTAYSDVAAGKSSAEVSQSDVLRVLNMRKSFDADARRFLLESGLTHDLRAPAGHDLDASETVLGSFSCWSPVRG